jgi:hypothetical protein
MKRTLVIAVMSLAVTAFGQGTVLFKNYFGSPATDPAVFFSDGAKLTGTQYIAGLEAGPASGSEVIVAGATAPFFTQAAGAGFFQDGVVSLPNVVGGATAFMKVLVWDTTLNGTTTGATWAQAVNYALANSLPDVAKFSAEFSVVTGDPSAIPPTVPALFNTGGNPLRPFGAIPEPSIFGFAGLGVAALMAFRARK